MSKLIALLLLAIAALSIGMLVSGGSYSEWVLPGGLPLGNALAAICLCSVAGAAFLLGPPGSLRRRASRTALLTAAFWLPLSIALAGNLELNFSGSAGTAWLALSLITASTVLGSLLLSVGGLLFGARGKSSAA